MPRSGDPWPFEETSAAQAAAVYALVDDVQSPSTTHISVVDKYGNAVSLTQTLSSFFGAGVGVPGLGMALNNQMQNFAGPGPSEPAGARQAAAYDYRPDHRAR